MAVIGGGKTRDTKAFVAPYQDNLVFAIDAWDKNSYPGSGTTWTDAVNGTEGTLGGGNGAAPDLKKGDGNVWFNFKGNPSNAYSGDDVSFTLPAFGTGAFTIGIWYRSENFVNWQTWVSTTRGGSGYNFGTDADGDIVYFVSPARRLTCDGALDPADNGAGNNIWRHIVMTRASSGGGLIGYLDGAQSGTGNDNQANLTTTSGYVGNLDGNNEYIDGDLPCVWMWNVTLTAAQILELFNNQKGRFGR